MEIVLGIVVMLIITTTFVELSNKKRRKGKSRKAMGAALFAIDEVFHPSAHESSIIMEEKRVERKAMPSPEDKENPAH